MALGDSYTEHVRDMFEQLRMGPVTIRRMFGGAGVYLGDDPIIGLVIDGALYLRVNDASRPAFEEAGSEPFSYTKKNGVRAVMPYWELPGSVLEDPRELRGWVRPALVAAREAAVKKQATVKSK